MMIQLLAMFGSAILALPASPAQDDLSWMSGHWCGGSGSQHIEETWLAANGHETIGMSRTMQGGRMVSFEYLRIQEIGGAIRLVAQPGGAQPVEFARSAGGKGWIRFENKAHDYPQRIEYRREGAGLYAEVGGPGEGGAESVIGYRYQRCPD